MRVAALDLGTNTFLLLIADVEKGRIEKVLHDEVRIVRLGQGVHSSRRFHPDALKRVDDCFASFAETIRNLGAEKVRACATSAARDVENAEELIALGRRHGIPIEVISGETEAEFTFYGTVQVPLKDPVLIIDVGGGSTELIIGGPGGLMARKSVDVGSVRLTEMFVTRHPIPKVEFELMSVYVRKQFEMARAELPGHVSRAVIAVAGTPTTIATLDQGLSFESERVEGYRLTLDRIRDWVTRLSNMTVEERQSLAGMEPKRADVIVAGGLVLLLAAEAFGAVALEVSTRGLRYGLAKR